MTAHEAAKRCVYSVECVDGRWGIREPASYAHRQFLPSVPNTREAAEEEAAWNSFDKAWQMANPASHAEANPQQPWID